MITIEKTIMSASNTEMQNAINNTTKSSVNLIGGSTQLTLVAGELKQFLTVILGSKGQEAYASALSSDVSKIVKLDGQYVPETYLITVGHTSNKVTAKGYELKNFKFSNQALKIFTSQENLDKWVLELAIAVEKIDTVALSEAQQVNLDYLINAIRLHASNKSAFAQMLSPMSADMEVFTLNWKEGTTLETTSRYSELHNQNTPLASLWKYITKLLDAETTTRHKLTLPGLKDLTTNGVILPSEIRLEVHKVEKKGNKLKKGNFVGSYTIPTDGVRFLEFPIGNLIDKALPKEQFDGVKDLEIFTFNYKPFKKEDTHQFTLKVLGEDKKDRRGNIRPQFTAQIEHLAVPLA